MSLDFSEGKDSRALGVGSHPENEAAAAPVGLRRRDEVRGATSLRTSARRPWILDPWLAPALGTIRCE